MTCKWKSECLGRLSYYGVLMGWFRIWVAAYSGQDLIHIFFNLFFFTRKFGFYFYLVSYPFLVTLLVCCVFCRLLYYSVSSSYLVNIGKGKISMRRRTRSNRSEKWLDSQQDHSANIWSWGLLILIRFVREALEL